MQQYKYLFSELKIGNKILKNRIILSPMGESMANYDGSISPQVIAYYKEKAKGGVAVVTWGVVNVEYPRGKTGDVKNRIDGPKVVKDLRRLAESIQRYGALFIPQLSHAGAMSTISTAEGTMPICVSDKDVQQVGIQKYRQVSPHKELTTQEVKELIQKFIDAAQYSKNAGCDGVSLHCAHGYLVNQFLSPDTNARQDEYGGNFENRIRFAIEIIQGIREKCGRDFIIGARIPGVEFVDDAMTEEECVEFARRMEKAGCDYLDVSVGMSKIMSKLIETEAYEQGAKLEYAAKIREAVSIPLGINGVLRDPQYCDDIIKEGKVDFVMPGRTLVCDPYWPQKAFEGKTNEIRPCISCIDGCFARVMQGYNLSCVLNPVAGREAELADLKITSAPKDAVVIGGGLAGMQAAIVAAQTGHKVILLEQSDKLGGQLNLACVPPYKEKIREAKNWFADELLRQGVEVKLNCSADLNTIKSLKADVIIFAAGAVPVEKIPVEGIEYAVQAWDVLKGKAKITDKTNVAVIGGGIVACEIAQLLIKEGKSVSIIEMLPQIASALEGIHLADLLREFEENNVNIYTNAAAKKITDKSVVFMKEGKEVTVPSDMTILSVGQKSQGAQLVKQLKDEGYKVIVIGDAKKPAKFINATLDGFYAGLDI